MGRILSFLKHAAAREELPRDWTNSEIAEFYRVEHALSAANIAIETDRGITDEGDPWFVFCRRDGEVIVHIARYDGQYHLFSPALPRPLEGASIPALTRAFLSAAPVAPKNAYGSRVVPHPSALLGLLVVSIFFSIDYLTGHAGRAEAAVATPPAPSAKAVYVQAIVTEMVGAMNGPEADEVAQLSLYAAQAALSFIEAGVGAGQPQVASIADEEAFAAPEAEGVNAVRPDDAASSPSLSASETAETVTPARSLATPFVRGSVSAPDSSAIAASQLDAPSASTASAIGPETTGASLGAGPNSLSAAVATSQPIVIVASSETKVVDLSGANATSEIRLSGDGSIVLTGLSGSASEIIDIVAGSHVALALDYGAAAGTVAQTLKLAGGSSVDLTAVSASRATAADVTVDSAGAAPNTLTVSDAAAQSAPLHLTIVGTENFVVNESASVLRSSSLDAAALRGNLTVGIDLSDSSSPTTLVGSSDFVVNANGMVELIHVPDNASIQVAIDLRALVLQFDPGAATKSVTIDLASVSGPSASVEVGFAEASGASTLDIAAGGAEDHIGALVDTSLATLEIQGAGSLRIGSLLGIGSAQSQNLTIDAGQLGGGLDIDLSEIADTAAGGRQITVIGGHGDNVVTEGNAAIALTIEAGSGQDRFNIADGAQAVTIKGWRMGDVLTVGGGQTADVVIDATHVSAASQAAINAAPLTAAADRAAALAGASVPHQAVLFVHDSNYYVFVGASGDHEFEAATDALVHIVGTVNSAVLHQAIYST